MCFSRSLKGLVSKWIFGGTGVSDCVLGSTENRISGSNPAADMRPVPYSCGLPGLHVSAVLAADLGEVSDDVLGYPVSKIFLLGAVPARADRLGES